VDVMDDPSVVLSWRLREIDGFDLAEHHEQLRLPPELAGGEGSAFERALPVDPRTRAQALARRNAEVLAFLRVEAGERARAAEEAVRATHASHVASTAEAAAAAAALSDESSRAAAMRVALDEARAALTAAERGGGASRLQVAALRTALRRAAERAAALEASGKKATGGLHKFDASEVDAYGGAGTADDFMDAFGF
ncbi:MAG: hypothetical protein VXW27_10055, partial [Pseudomonadota bacterium]|nr:hypothetical protein [Pseudomonadota bacterium]